MFDYTTALIRHTLEQIKISIFKLIVLTQLLYIGYLVYAIIVDSGIFISNVILLIVSCLYLAFFIYDSLKKRKRTVPKRVKELRSLIKRLILRSVKLYTLIAMVVIFVTGKNANPLAPIVIILSAISFVIQIVLDIITLVITKRIDLFKEAFENDIREIKQPFTETSNFLKKLLGKGPKSTEPTKNFDFLKQLVEAEKTRRAEEKQWKKQKTISEEEIAISTENEEE